MVLGSDQHRRGFEIDCMMIILTLITIIIIMMIIIIMARVCFGATESFENLLQLLDHRVLNWVTYFLGADFKQRSV